MPEWTANQKTAIEYHGGNLLVSAAAGSGKTAVLVERVLRRLTDPENPVDINRFLIVTFTNAAAAEMRMKIREAIEKQLKQSPGNKRLLRQLRLLPSARIGTIHSFCFGLIRANFQALSLPANVRIAGEAEVAKISGRVLEELIEESFEMKDADFLVMVDQLSDSRDNDAIAELVLQQSAALLCQADIPEQVQRALDAYRIKPGQVAASPWGKEVIDRFRLTLSYWIRRYEGLERIIAEDAVCVPYIKNLEEDLLLLRSLLRACDISWDAVCEKLSQTEYGRLTNVRKESPYKKLIKKTRDSMKDDIDAAGKKMICESEKEICDGLPEQEATARALLSLSCTYIQRFREAKVQRGLVDFSDIEHYAYGLLAEKNAQGETVPTALARELGEQFAEVMVDEYQDTNGLQDAIFQAITKERKNLFMVGDVKQSIYRFRKADPGIFLSKYNAFPTVSLPEEESGDRRRTLSDNFRSRAQVVDAVNEVFHKLCIPEFSEISYGEEEELHAKRPDADNPFFDAELHMISKDDGEEDTEPPEEADIVAARIRELLDSGMMIPRKDRPASPIRPEDVVILLRSDKGRAAKLARALIRLGVPCRAEGEGNFCDSLEVHSALSCMQALDNPQNDIALLGFLRSPGLAFDADMLAALRLNSKNGCIFDALTKTAQTEERAKEALETLTELRKIARRSPVSLTLRKMYEKLSVPAGFGGMENGEVRRKNLSMLQGVADSYSANVGGDLHGFLSYMEAMKKPGDRKEPVSDREAVTVMTIHRSKGLEYPVVVLSAAGKKFNKEDQKQAVSLHGALGIGTRRRDVERRLSFSTLPLDAIHLRKLREGMAEELRILYVALTRAREKLIVFTEVSKTEDYLAARRWEILSAGITAYKLSKAAGMGDWLWQTMLAETDGGLESFGEDCSCAQAGAWKLYYHRGDKKPEVPVCVSPAQAEEKTDGAGLTGEQLIARAFTPYPYQTAAETPSKRTVTQLKGREKDGELETEPSELKDMPLFLSEQKPAAGTERGTAYHMVFSHMELSKTDPEDVEGCIKEMVSKQLLSEEAARSVNPSDVVAFFKTPLGKLLSEEKDRVQREFKFSVLVDADTEGDGEKVMLQGVADAILLREDSLILLDYKTDRCREPDKEKWLSRMEENYRPQVENYARALERIFLRPVTEKYLCFITEKENVKL